MLRYDATKSQHAEAGRGMAAAVRLAELDMTSMGQHTAEAGAAVRRAFVGRRMGTAREATHRLWGRPPSGVCRTLVEGSSAPAAHCVEAALAWWRAERYVRI